MSHPTQMLQLGAQNLLSAATGISVAMAVVRGFAGHACDDVGKAWVDVTRATLWVLLPLSVVLALLFAAQGVVQNLDAGVVVSTLERTTYPIPKLDDAGTPPRDARGFPLEEARSAATQTLAMGPVASQEAIKMLLGEPRVEVLPLNLALDRDGALR